MPQESHRFHAVVTVFLWCLVGNCGIDHGCGRKTTTNRNANPKLAECKEGNDLLSGEGIQNPVSHQVDRILSVETQHIATRQV